MQIILVDRRLARARTITVKAQHVVAAAVLLTLTVVVLSTVFSLLTVRAATVLPLPFVSDVIALVTRDQTERKEQYFRDNVQAVARKLGEVQAQLLRLDMLSERVAKAAGIRPEEFRFRELPGRGGAPGTPISMNDLEAELQGLTRGVEQRSDYLSVVEAELRSQQVRKALLPGSQPVADGFIGSGFGWRTDPFTGEMTRHEGIDFAAPVGTPIHAAAGGVVVLAERHPVWGNVVEIDHGKGLMTRYAHASRLLVGSGALVRRGQTIAEVGTTGRSTGPHLHFEVHSNGVAQNPAKFLFAEGSPLQQQASSGGRTELKALANAASARN
ncbi:MAG TPA: M23 family metallopeptidase [Burkholderiaceae bacterium]|nr:M23 family metallopeptidase [Burkholderiaceae bacterium]HQR71835.1 M23 family metallopeptidase [Burkholderiaceae bacterium]